MSDVFAGVVRAGADQEMPPDGRSSYIVWQAPSVRVSDICKLKVCDDRAAWLKETFIVNEVITAAEAAARGATLQDIAWAAQRLGKNNLDIATRYRLFLADCAERVLHLYERQFPGDHRPRAAIQEARRFNRRGADGRVLSDARSAIIRAANQLGYPDRESVGLAARAAFYSATGQWEAANCSWNLAQNHDLEAQWQTGRLLFWLSTEVLSAHAGIAERQK